MVFDQPIEKKASMIDNIYSIENFFEEANSLQHTVEDTAFIFLDLAQSYKNKLLILSSGDLSVRFRPHLTVTKEEIDIAIDILYKSIKEILN